MLPASLDEFSPSTLTAQGRQYFAQHFDIPSEEGNFKKQNIIKYSSKQFFLNLHENYAQTDVCNINML